MELLEGKIYSIRYKNHLMSRFRFEISYIICTKIHRESNSSHTPYDWVYFYFLDDLDNDQMNSYASLQTTFDIEEVKGFVE